MPWNNDQANLIIIDESGEFTGLFAYNPAPGLGNLTYSDTAAAGTDPFGNAYLPGSVAYLNEGTHYLALQQYAGSLRWWSNATFGGIYSLINEIVLNASTDAVQVPGPFQAETTLIAASSSAVAATAGLLEVQGTVAVGQPASAPAAVAGYAVCYVDSSGDLHILNPEVFTSGSLNVNGGKSGNVFAVGTGPSDFQGTVYLEDTATPGTPGTASAVYSDSGQLMYVSEDSNPYNTGVLHIDLPNTSVTAVTPAFTTIGPAVPVGAQKYKIHIRGWYAEAAAGTPRFSISIPATSAEQFSAFVVETSASASFGGAAASGQVLFVGPAMGSHDQVLDYWAECTFSASGSLQFEANTSVMADSFTWESGFMELYPIS